MNLNVDDDIFWQILKDLKLSNTDFFSIYYFISFIRMNNRRSLVLGIKYLKLLFNFAKQLNGIS